MSDEPPPELTTGIAGALSALRHALADPLSAAGLKLELLGRRLAASPDGAGLPERLEGVRRDLAVASRLLDLLARLARIEGEARGEVHLHDLCRLAGLGLEEEAHGPSLRLRRRATLDALRAVGSLLRPAGAACDPPMARAEVTGGSVHLRIESAAAGGEQGRTGLERQLRLPSGDDRERELFLARAAIEADGGRLQLGEQDGRLVALLSWPGPAPCGNGEPAA